MTIPLNPGVVRTVAWLNEKGFRTTDSGDGATHAAECDRPDPYVVIQVDDPDKLIKETRRLGYALLGRDVKVGGLTEDGLAPGTVYIQANYSPHDGLALIDVTGLTDALLFETGER